MWDEGYGDADARVDTIVVDTAAKSASHSRERQSQWPTVVGRISISGNERVSERTIRNSLTLEEGHPYKRQELITSQRNLYESNLFRRAVIIVPPQGDSIKHIEITVQEAPLREIRASAGFNTYEFGQVETRLTRYNWFGGGRRLDFRAAVGNIAADALNARFPFQEVPGTGVGRRRRSILLAHLAGKRRLHAAVVHLAAKHAWRRRLQSPPERAGHLRRQRARCEHDIHARCSPLERPRASRIGTS